MNLEAFPSLRVGSRAALAAVKRLRYSFVILALCQTAAFAQVTTTANPPSAPAAATIDQYIHQAWDTLSRSMTECKSLIDPKLKTAPVLYLPQEIEEPPQMAALRSQCNVDVERLPHRITRLGEVDPRSIKVPGLLYLPNKYVVPGGRFNEMYGWDSYFILLGLLRDGRVELARGMVENFFFEIEHYGGLLNANRTYYLSRSQPPFLSSMIRDVYEAQLAAMTSGPKRSDVWLLRAYGYAVRDHNLWLSDFHRAGDTGLARYFDLDEGPVPEQEDDSTYYPDVIRWLLAHPDVHTDYLVDGPDQPNAAQAAELAKTSCDISVSHVCEHAHVDGHWLSADFYRGDRAMRESGYDPSFRFGPFSGSTHHNAPICLNSLLYKYERDLAWMADKLGKQDEARQWNAQADARKAAINKYLWNASEGMYFDYDFMAHKQSTYRYVTTFYPLWAGLADDQQIKGLEKALHWFRQPGGLAMSTFNSGTQWDLPYGWAPPSWVAIAGFWKVGDIPDARSLSESFSRTIKTNFDRDKTIVEKYDVVNGSSQLDVATGYKANQVGFGWSNAAYLKMQQLLAETGSKK